jgi:hypothetical protein
VSTSLSLSSSICGNHVATLLPATGVRRKIGMVVDLLHNLA